MCRYRIGPYEVESALMEHLSERQSVCVMCRYRIGPYEVESALMEHLSERQSVCDVLLIQDRSVRGGERSDGAPV